MEEFGTMVCSYINTDETEGKQYAELFHIDYYGYAEPVEKYHVLKDYVKDIWYLDVGCSRSLVGKNMTERWFSCKKEHAEHDEEDWEDLDDEV